MKKPLGNFMTPRQKAARLIVKEIVTIIENEKDQDVLNYLYSFQSYMSQQAATPASKINK